jgi:glycogen synthase
VEVLLCASGLERRDLDDCGVLVHARPFVPATSTPLRLSFHDGLAVVTSFYREHRRLGRTFDVIQAPEFMAPALLIRPPRRTSLVVRLSTPTIVTFESNLRRVDRRVVLADHLERRAVKRADAIVAPSWYLVRRLRERGWLGEKAVTILPTPVDLETWSGIGSVRRTEPVILSVGRVEHNKGSDVILDAAARLMPLVSGLRVVFAGRSSGTVGGRPWVEWVASRAADLGVPCSFPGELSASELRHCYEQARVVVIASRHDSWSNVGLEALASGRPVVSTETSGISELLRRLDAAAVVPAASAQRLADAMLRYLNDADLADAVGAEGRRLVASELNPSRVAEQWERTYEEVLQRSRSL